MQFSCHLHPRTGKLLEKFSVNGFHKIIARLVKSVDGSFGLRDFRGRRERSPRTVFFVPQREILPMLFDNERFQTGSSAGLWLGMPTCGEVVVNFYDARQVHGRCYRDSSVFSFDPIFCNML